MGVPPGHPLHEVDYGDIDVDAHGGLTYSDFCVDGPEGHAICHIPDPGEPEHVWWLGFDCAHSGSGDLVPGMISVQKKYGLSPLLVGQIYRTLDYVREECARLAKQIA